MGAGSATSGLTFKLGLSTAAALQDFRRFTKEVTAEGKRIVITPKISIAPSGGTGAGGSKDPGKEYARRFEKSLSAVDKVYAQFNGRIATEAKVTERILTRAFDQMSSGKISTRKFEQVVNGQLKLLTDVGKGIERRAAQDKKVSQDAFKEQQKTQKQAEADAKKLTDQQQKDAETAQKRSDALHKKQQDAAKRKADAIIRIEKDAAAALERIDISRGVTDIQLRQRANDQIRAIMLNAHGMELTDVKRQLQMVEAEYRKHSALRVSESRSNSRDLQAEQNAAAKNMSRNMNALFNVQQAVEDFSYAGVRGLTNNLAWLASSLGGPGGIIAMVGVMGLTMPALIDRMSGASEATQKLNERIKEQIDLYARLLDAQTRFKADTRANAADIMEDPHKEKRRIGDAEAGLGDMRDQRRRMENDKNMLTALVKINEEIKKRQNEIQAQPFESDVPRLKAEIADLERKRNTMARGLANRHRELPPASELESDPAGARGALEEKIRGIDADMADAQQQIDLAKKRYDEITNSGAAESYKAFKDLDLGNLTPKLGEAAEGVENLRERFREFYADRDKALKDLDDKQREEVEQKAADAISSGEHAKAKKILDDFVEKNRRWAEDTKAARQAWADLADGFGKAHSELDQMADATERMIKNGERRIEQLKEEVEQLRKAKKEGQDAYASSVHGVKTGLVDRFADKEAERRKEADEAFLRQQFTDSKGKTPKGLDELIQKRAKMIDEQVEAQRRAAQDQLLGSRLGVLGNRSRGAAGAGDYEGARSSAEEAQGLLLERAGEAETQAEANRYLAEAERIQGEINRLYDEEIAVKEKAKADTEAEVAKLKEYLDEIKAKMTEIETLDLFAQSQASLAAMNAAVDAMLAKLRGAAGIPGMGLGDGAELPGGPVVPGQPQASSGLPGAAGYAMGPTAQAGVMAASNVTRNSTSSKTTNNVSNNNTVNVGSVSVAGRTSARGMADDLRRNAKARDMRTGMA